MSKELSYEAESTDSGTLCYRLSGWLYGTTSGYAFQEAIREKVAGGTRRFVIDLSGVQRIDSCGIGILAASIFSAQKAGAGMVLAALPDHVSRMLGLTMFLDHIATADTVDEAVEKVEGMELSS
jgi:anti-anti-sigma factor